MPQVTTTECNKTHTTLMNELTDIKVAIAELPEKILEKTDGRYASKGIEETVKKLSDKSDARTFEWLRAIAIAIISAIIALVAAKYK